MSKKKKTTYVVVAPKDPKEELRIHIPASKPCSFLRTTGSAQYSYYTKATKKAEHSLKKELRSYQGHSYE